MNEFMIHNETVRKEKEKNSNVFFYSILISALIGLVCSDSRTIVEISIISNNTLVNKNDGSVKFIQTGGIVFVSQSII